MAIRAYRTDKADFRSLVRQLIPTRWQFCENPGVSITAFPPGTVALCSEFKIHISILHEQAKSLLETVIPIFLEERVCFKVLADERVLDYSNSHLWEHGSRGRFITVYANDIEQLKSVMERLHQATRRYIGPYIVSDKRYKDSKVLFYRYTKTKNHQRLISYGDLSRPA